MELRLYNTLSRSLEKFAPLDPPLARLYTCGPTVYNYQHAGNYRTYIFEDILKKTLLRLGYTVRHVMNITDVGHLTSQADEGEDKMEVGASREGLSAWDIAKKYTEAFLADCRELRIAPPDVLCRATDHIQEQIALIKRLEDKGFLYKTSDGLYFDTSRFPSYGKLSGGGSDSETARGRVEANPEKKHPADFAVWKFSPTGKKRQMEWDSPWGKGFPGWHIECSAMAMKYLGESFDIHCGGVDHIPIHHANEIAQAEGATGKPFVRFWLHGEFLLSSGAKMAKSAGGFVTMAEIKKNGFSPLDYRYHCLTAHYRKQLDFSWELLESAKTSRRRLRETVRKLGAKPSEKPPEDCLDPFIEALADDLNAPAALAAFWDCLRREDVPAAARLGIAEEAEKILALGLFDDEMEAVLDEETAVLVRRREEARKSKNFALSDRLRLELLERGVIVEDTAQGQKWRKK